MKNKKRVYMGRIIGKVDNDFNLSESDWIPRAAAWIIDALSQMKCLPTELKTRKVEVSGRIAIFPCQLDTSELKVYDRNGCEIKEAGVNIPCCGNVNSASSVVKEIAVIDDSNKTGVDFMKVGTIIDGDNRNYVVTDCNHIELNFDTDFITIRNLEIATEHSDYFNGEIPVVPNNGLLIEALAYYCMYKMLTRGMKHPVFNLAASQYGTNSYYMWMQLKDKAKASVIADNQGVNGYDGDAWCAYFYNYTFPK